MIVHALPVAGGILAIAPLPGRDGDYAGDMAHLDEWRPAMVISLVTMAELNAAGAQEIGQHVQEHGARWAHLPIADFGTPDEPLLEHWPELSRFARRALSGGGRVLVHCRGGCGRSGMVALRLMIEAGEAGDEALARLRAVRPCAVETSAQMRWAMAARREAAQFLRHED
ncbi:dual specificity protein phosphatase family protein [Salipiger abyssi]|uniref:Dual specificity phosphatase n=1 Tax=Salipiger abyssi TaxID=1250539 RepID=A0A1P8UWN4_9RHOB|nr:dual specificity protein phosphatase family protein [Salipiger abyssi]APZ53795.1 Dual specificity phosphatase [Salipiger abyssi]